AGGAVCAGTAPLPSGRDGEAWPRVARRDEGESERVEAQGDELRAHAEGRAATPREGRGVAESSSSSGRRGGQSARQAQARRRVAGGPSARPGSARANRRAESGAGG